MTTSAITQYLAFGAIVALLAKPVGLYLLVVLERRRPFPAIERWLYRSAGVDPRSEMTWPEYARAFLLFSLVGTLLLYGVLRLQALLPGGPAAASLVTPMTPDLAANIAVSFATTTTWQAYAGETTLRYATQLVGLTSQNFLAGGAGLALGFAFLRGFARAGSATLGNFWVDVTRAVLYVLLPLGLLWTPVLIWQGVPMTFAGYAHVTTLQGAGQTIALGPVAGLEAIKNLGTNGGGFFNANGAHPFENPTPLTNFLELLAIVVVPAGMPYAFGRATGRREAGWSLFVIMAILFSLGLVAVHVAEAASNPHLAALGVTGGNLEGKETRFGVAGSVLGAVVTSNAATGSYVAMHDSFSPGGVLVMLVNLFLGEIAFGGLGTGLFSLVMIAIVGMFLTGLMVGRTPEYCGKMLGIREMRYAAIYALLVPAVVLPLSALAVSTVAGRAALTTNAGAHGLSEIVFAYASCAANNGMSMAGLSVNAPFYNATLLLPMMAGRFGLAIPALAIAGSVAAQRTRPVHAGTVPSEGGLFVGIVVATSLLVGALTYFPVLALGPIVEHLALHR
jgi:potassium-transporting ATPase potassium-binding subunit